MSWIQIRSTPQGKLSQQTVDKVKLKGIFKSVRRVLNGSWGHKPLGKRSNIKTYAKRCTNNLICASFLTHYITMILQHVVCTKLSPNIKQNNCILLRHNSLKNFNLQGILYKNTRYITFFEHINHNSRVGAASVYFSTLKKKQ